jgi:glycosyltransferase involved in cell wall biosynthesis
MPISHAPALQPLVQRAIKTSKSDTVAQIFEWGQFHRSRLSLHVLASLAHPSDPDVFWRSDDAFPEIERAPLHLEALCALASGLVLQPRDDSDRRRALALFDLANRRLGGRLDPAHQDLHIMAAHLSGDKARTRRLLRSYRDCTTALRNAFACLDAHPQNGGSLASLEQALSTLSDWDDLRLSPDPAQATIDGLTTDVKPGFKSGPLISVIMTCFNPGPALLTAVKSIQAQSWKHWELFVVDDASGPEYADILREVAEIDPRVTVLVQPENGGTYKARNRAITAANGDFITGLDSDDWAHPRRLERQVRPLLKNASLVAAESCALSTTTDLKPIIDPQVDVIAARSTLVMFRTKPIRERIGFYDEVRKNGDSEFIRRIRSEFGPRSWVRVDNRPLTIMRREGETLSAGEISRAWMSAGRFAYHSSFMQWHRRIKAKSSPALLDSLPVHRPFPLSVSLTMPGGEATFTYDRVYAADWRLLGKSASPSPTCPSGSTSTASGRSSPTTCSSSPPSTGSASPTSGPASHRPSSSPGAPTWTCSPSSTPRCSTPRSASSNRTSSPRPPSRWRPPFPPSASCGDATRCSSAWAFRPRSPRPRSRRHGPRPISSGCSPAAPHWPPRRPDWD